MDSLDVGGVAIPRAGVNAGLAGLAAEIARRAVAERILVGWVRLEAPGRVIGDLAARRPRIVKDVLAFLRARRPDDGDGREADVWLDEYGDELLHVGHFPTMRTRVDAGGVEVEWDEKVTPKVRDLINERVVEKRRLLEGETRPKILALFANYPFAMPAHYVEAFASVKANDFAAVIVVHSCDDVTVLAWRLPRRADDEAGLKHRDDRRTA
jgi:hypothetical protein